MADVVHNAIESMTGHRPTGCPWAVFADPFVQRVLVAYDNREDGNLLWAEPDPSNRLVEGVNFYGRKLSSIQAQQFAQERKEREEAAKRG